MWLPTAGKVVGKIRLIGLFGKPNGGAELVCVSHTGKTFEIETTLSEAIATPIGQVVFCNGDFCRRMYSWEAAIERLNKVNNSLLEEK